MQTNDVFEFDATCLGVCGLTATWRRTRPDIEKGRWEPLLVIKAASATDEGAFIPASDISITSVQGMLALRAAIDEALKYDMPKQAEA
jgi:hypothetical protein